MADGALGMPEVDVPPDLEERFRKAWRIASGQEPAAQGDAPIGQRYIVIMTPGRMLMAKPCPHPNSMPAAAVQAIEKIAPPAPPLNITVIAFTRLDQLMKNMKEAIPFVGYLFGLGYIGHNVVVFEGHSTALAAGCRDADMLIVDEAMVPYLQQQWASAAWGVMRGAKILVFARNGSLKQVVGKARA